MASREPKGQKDVDQALRDIEAGVVEPVYVFHGPNTLLIEKAIERLKSKVVGDSSDFAYRAFRGEEAKGVDVVATARTVPMLADRQLLVVRHADAFAADDQTALLAYLEAPNPMTCLVLAVEKVDKRLKLFALAGKLGFVFEASALAERDLTGWVASRARAIGLALSPNAARLLGESTGTDTATIEDALERLRLFVGDREAAADDVDAVVSSSRVRSIFELTDALGRRNATSALRTLTNMLRNREAPLRILATLATHVRRLVMTKELLESRTGEPIDLPAEVGVPPFLARKLADQADSFSAADLRRALVRLARTDLELKSARRSDELVLEEMVLDLCLGASTGRTGKARPSFSS